MSDNPYCHIASWGGGNGVWTNMENNPPLIYLRDGDVIMGTVSGTNPVVITLYVNGAQVLQVARHRQLHVHRQQQARPVDQRQPGLRPVR